MIFEDVNGEDNKKSPTAKKMSVLQSHQCLFSFSLPHRLRTPRLISLYRPPESTSPLPSLSAFTRTRPDRIRVSAAEETSDVAEEVEDGPVELPPSPISPFSTTNSIFATSDDPSPLQLATSVMLTGAITVFLFRSIRRRAKRSKEMVKFSSFLSLSTNLN